VPDLQKNELIWMGNFVFFLEKGETQTVHSPLGLQLGPMMRFLWS
jgi:hypothetical protein